MSETGGPVYEGVGKPEAKPVRGVKDRLNYWAKRTFTMEGREDVQREKIVKNFEKVSKSMTPEQKQASAELLSKNIDALAHKKAVGSIRRDVIVAAVGVPLVGLGIWKRDKIGQFVLQHTPDKVLVAGTTAAVRARQFGESIKGWSFVQRVDGWVKAIASRFVKRPAPLAG